MNEKILEGQGCKQVNKLQYKPWNQPQRSSQRRSPIRAVACIKMPGAKILQQELRALFIKQRNRFHRFSLRFFFHFIAPEVKMQGSKLGQPGSNISNSLAEFAARRRRIKWDHFLRRRARRRKYSSVRKCANRPSKAGDSCAQWTAIFYQKSLSAFLIVLPPCPGGQGGRYLLIFQRGR